MVAIVDLTLRVRKQPHAEREVYGGLAVVQHVLRSAIV
jgi:hypothetical protein